MVRVGGHLGAPSVRRLCLGLLVLAATTPGCNAASSASAPAAGETQVDAQAESTVDGGLDADDPDPVFTDAQWAALQELSPDALPPPPTDVSNRFADDSAAAALGQELFFDSSFSGPLLDTDNDGSPATLGVAGQTGKVACAGCHIPKRGFSDTRSFQLQISLGAGWGDAALPRCSTWARRRW